MAVELTAVDLDTIPYDGGYKLTLTGIFETGTEHKVYIGPVGAVTDPQAFGEQGDGGSVYPKSATSLEVYSPLLQLGGPHDIFIVQVATGLTDELHGVLTAVRSDFKSKVFGMRQLYPPFYFAGPRRMDSVP